MLKVKIEDKQYNIVYDWSDITIQNAIDYYAIEQPEVLKELNKLFISDYDAYLAKYKELTQRERMITMPDYYGRVLSLFSTIPQETIDRIFWRARTEVFEKYLLRFTLGLDYTPNFEPRGIRFFTFKGHDYYLPDADRLSAIEFCEAADLEAMGHELMNKGEVMTRLIAVLCRPEGELYDEDTIKQRIELFKDVSLDVVWEVSFFFTEYLGELKQNAVDCLKAALKPGKQPSSQASVDSVGGVH